MRNCAASRERVMWNEELQFFSLIRHQVFNLIADHNISSIVDYKYELYAFSLYLGLFGIRSNQRIFMKQFFIYVVN